MAKIRNSLGKKAARATFRHTVRGFTAKARRRPFRSTTLLTVGGLVGAVSGWLAGRRSS